MFSVNPSETATSSWSSALVVMTALAAFVLVLALLCRPTISALTLTGPSLIQPGFAVTNATSLGYGFTCSGAEYGRNLDSASCMDALHQIDASSAVEQTYGMRFTGPYDVKLPKRYISGLLFLLLVTASKRLFLRTNVLFLNSQQTDTASSSRVSFPRRTPPAQVLKRCFSQPAVSSTDASIRYRQKAEGCAK